MKNQRWLLGVQVLAALFVATAFPAMALANGGVGSGGGGTLPSDKVTISDIHDAIVDSRNLIDAFLKGAERDYTYSQAFHERPLLPPSYSLFFSGPESVFDVIPRVQVLMLTGSPCMGTDGNPYDGSVNEGPNTICMAAGRMAEKLNSANYRSEVAALMLHELSHLLGATEEQAVEIQKCAVRFFATKDSSAVFEWTYEEMDRVRSYSQTLEMAAAAVQSRAKVSCSQLQSVLGGGMETVWNIVDAGHGMFLTREKDTEYYSQVSLRLIAIADFLCSQPEFGDGYERPVYQDKIQKIFGDQPRIEATRYLRSDRQEPLVTVWVPRYKTIDEAVTDIQSAQSDMDELGRKLNEQWQLKFPML